MLGLLCCSQVSPGFGTRACPGERGLSRRGACRYLDKAVAVVLAFIGGKMVLDQVPGGFHIDTTTSLAVVATCLAGGTAASLLLPEPEGGEEGSKSS